MRDQLERGLQAATSFIIKVLLIGGLVAIAGVWQCNAYQDCRAHFGASYCAWTVFRSGR